MTSHEQQQPRQRRRVAVAAVAGAVALVLALVAALVVTRDGDDDTRTAGAPDTTGTTAPAATTDGSDTPTTSATAPTTATAPTASALDGLTPFLDAAADLDARLHDAAEAVNSAGPPWPEVPASVAEKVTAADVTAVARTVPAGLPPDLLEATILVYSDLVSRRGALQGFAHAGPAAPTDELLSALRNGHAAAERFDDDLAALRARAAAAAPFTPARPEDRATAETLLLLRYTEGANLGCDGRGGWIATELPPIRWSEDDPPEHVGPEWDHHGTIGGIPFAAHREHGGTWTIQLWAC